MKIIKATIMTADEVAAHLSWRNKENNDKQSFSSKWCSENIRQLIKWHREYKDAHLTYKYEQYLKGIEKSKAYLQDQNDIWDKVVRGETVKCICGSNLRLITNLNFIGCSNFRDTTVAHSKNISSPSTTSAVMPYSEFLKDPYNQDFGKQYLNGFRSFYDIPAKVMASVIFEFLFTISKETPYCKDLTAEYFQTANKSKLRANKEELIIKGVLQQKFDKVAKEIYIRYTTDTVKNQIAVPDFVCSNDTMVVVFDVKKALANSDMRQLNLYQDLVEFIQREKELSQHQSPKRLSSYTILYSDEDKGSPALVKECRGLFIDDLKSLPIL